MSRRSSSKSPPSTTRLFTEKDEINLLKSLLTSAAKPLPEGNFSESQIAGKIRRLKQKYHKFARSKSFIKTPHDRNIYEIAGKIWGKEKTIMPSPTQVITETKENDDDSESMITWSDFPSLMREVSGAFPGIEELYKQGLKGLGCDILKGLDDKWMALEMEEAAIQARKLELCYNCLK